jgi:hypothetical protein
MVAFRRGGVAALVILALASSVSAVHALQEGSPDQYLAVKLGMPTVRPRPARISHLRRVSLAHRAPSRRALLTSTHALPTQTNDGKKPRADEEKSDVYQHMHSRTTEVGEGSTSAKEIATKALKVLSRLARSDTSDEAAKLSHSPLWTDDLVDDLDDDPEDDFVDDYDDDDWDKPRAALGRGRDPRGGRAIARRDASTSLERTRSRRERGREPSRRGGERFRAAALGDARAERSSTEQDEDADPHLLDPARLGANSRSSKKHRRQPRRALDRDEDDDEDVRTRHGHEHHRAHSRSHKHEHSSRRGFSRSSDGGSRRRRRDDVASAGEEQMFLDAMSRKSSASDGGKTAAEVAASFKDPDTRITVDDPDGTSNSFTIRELGFEDAAVDGENARLFVEGGREYWDELYAKGALLYDGALNTTRRWVDDYQESGRSHRPIRVDLYVDAADPYSLELILGPVQHLLKMDLGPLVWSFKPHSNIGQDRAKRVKCGGGHSGTNAARVSCEANAIIACAGSAFRNLTSGLGLRNARAVRPTRRLGTRLDPGATVTSGKSLRGGDGGSPRSRALLARSYEGEYDLSGEAFDDRDDSFDITSRDWMPPAFTEDVSTSTSDAFDDTKAPQNVFVKCFSTKMLELESVGAFGFNDARSMDLGRISADCCETAMITAPASLGGGNVTTCRAMSECVASDMGFDALSKASDELHALVPQHKWLPWVVVAGKPVCLHSCNLQKGIRRAVCNAREGTLPGDCPRFPWAKIWYDEPGVSLAGIVGVVVGLVLTTGSMLMLAQQAGLCCWRTKTERASGEKEPLLSDAE